MEKILMIINPRSIKISDIDYACSIANLTHSQLTGFFVEDQNFKLIPLPEQGQHSHPGETDEKAGSEQQPLVMNMDQGILYFTELCRKKNVPFATCRGKGNPVEDVVYESRFADLILIDPETSFSKKEEAIPTHFVKEVLAGAECPVIITSNLLENIDEIFFCYDSGKSSVFAIKQFTYLLPQFSNKKVVLLEINPSAGEKFNEGHKHMMNWLKTHYHSVGFQSLEGNVKEEMFQYFFMKRNVMIVLGAYGRGMLSYIFTHSTADKLVRNVDLPLFITHY